VNLDHLIPSEITLATLNTFSTQEVFDYVSRHLLKQNKRSKDADNETCMYRGIGGLKCAAGVLVSDEEYKPLMEGKPFSVLVDLGFLKHSQQVGLVSRLQGVHDDYEPYKWPAQLEIVAHRFGLNHDIVDGDA
jgi:hypothetical protein